MLEVKGHNGQIIFDGQTITITRRGILGRMTVGKGQKTIHIAQISGVQWKPAGPFVNGFIQFTVPGGNERRSQFGAQTTTAVNDENSVVFTTKHQAAFEQLRDAVNQAIATQHTPTQAAQPAGIADQLAKLADLHAQGVISVEEFEAGKKRILGG